MHVSSGAIVYKLERDNGYRIVLMYRQSTDSYHLPKGTRNPGETLISAAKREIFEETGCEVELGEHLTVLYSQFKKEEKVFDKETHYFAAKLIRQMEVHDSEHDKILWLSVEEAMKLLKEKEAHIRLGFENEAIAVEEFRKTTGENP